MIIEVFTPKQLLYSTTTKKESIYEKRMALTGEDPHVGLFVWLIPLLCSLRPFFLKKTTVGKSDGHCHAALTLIQVPSL